jgi:uncharacterized protein (TIGR02466 family)
MQIQIQNRLVNNVNLTEIQPFVNSIYAVENAGIDLSSAKSAINLSLSDTELWFNRITGGKQTRNLSLNEFPDLRYIFNQIEPIVDNIVKSWGVTIPTKLKHFFINIDDTNSYTTSHCHYNSILSGVFYIQVPEQSGNITFERPDNQEYHFKGQELNAYSYSFFTLPPRENMLLLFPSFIKHRVELHKFSNDQKRISISFDYGAKL